MARGRKKPARRRTRKFTGINLPQVLIGYAGASIWSEALLKVSPIQFIMSKEPRPAASDQLTLKEIIDSFMGGTGGVAGNWTGPENNALQMIGRNAQRSWVDATIKSVGLTAGSAIGLKLTKKPRAFLNRQIRAFGMGDLIKF